MLNLVLLSSSLHWKETGKEDGISVPWPKISVHAITSEPQKSIYLMLDFALVWPGVHEPNLHRNGNGHAVDVDEEDEGHVDGWTLTKTWYYYSILYIWGVFLFCLQKTMKTN